MAKAKAQAKSKPSKSKSVSKADLIKGVADGKGASKAAVKAVLDGMLGKISGHLDKGAKVQLTGFGTFEVRDRKARTGVRPGTTEKIKIPAGKYPAFKAGKGLKDKAKR